MALKVRMREVCQKISELKFHLKELPRSKQLRLQQIFDLLTACIESEKIRYLGKSMKPLEAFQLICWAHRQTQRIARGHREPRLLVAKP